MKDGNASENKNVCLKVNIFMLTVLVNQTSTLPFMPVCHYTETIALIYKAN